MSRSFSFPSKNLSVQEAEKRSLDAAGCLSPAASLHSAPGPTEMSREAPAHEPFLPAATLVDLGACQLQRFRSSSSKKPLLGGVQVLGVSIPFSTQS